MNYLLDTCAISELNKVKPDPKVVAFITGKSAESFYISVITLGELTHGICALASGKRRKQLEAWLHEIEAQFADRVLGLDAKAAKHWGEHTAIQAKKGIVVPPLDGLIAAIAKSHRLTVVTRNQRHFIEAGAQVVNPWVS